MQNQSTNSMAPYTYEIIRIHHLLTEIELNHSSPAELWCDNQAVHIVLNPIYHERTKKTKVYYHFIRKKIPDNLKSIGCVKTTKLVNLLTKAQMEIELIIYVTICTDQYHIYAKASGGMLTVYSFI